MPNVSVAKELSKNTRNERGRKQLTAIFEYRYIWVYVCVLVVSSVLKSKRYNRVRATRLANYCTWHNTALVNTDVALFEAPKWDVIYDLWTKTVKGVPEF